MLINSQHQATLDELGCRLEGQGFGVRLAPYFAENGICAFIHPEADTRIRVIEKSVFLYATPEGWCARVTSHGGPHWTRVVESISTLEEAALEALGATHVPPAGTWIAASQ